MIILTKSKAKTKGFSLMELIIVIVLLGIMAAGISGFMGLATQTYVNVTARDELMSSARFAIERMNREIRNAVPNSIRVKSDTTRQCIEFIPMVASTIYTEIPVKPDLPANTIKVINFINHLGEDYSCSAGSCFDLISVYPLSYVDLYSPTFTGEGRAFNLTPFIPPIGQTEWTIGLVPPLPFPGGATGNRFDEHSPTKRLYIYELPVSYCINGGELKRHEGHGLNLTQLLTPTGGSSLMAENLAPIDITDLPFKVENATLQRNSLVQIKLHFTKNEEDIVFNNEIHIQNVP